MSNLPKPLPADKFGEALIAAGVISKLDDVSRVVIDAQVGHVVVMYIERLGDERLLDVGLSLDGVEIRGVPGSRESDEDLAS